MSGMEVQLCMLLYCKSIHDIFDLQWFEHDGVVIRNRCLRFVFVEEYSQVIHSSHFTPKMKRHYIIHKMKPISRPLDFLRIGTFF